MTKEQFAAMAERHRERLVRLTVVRGHDRDVAEDLVQNAIIYCLELSGKYRGAKPALLALKSAAWSASGTEIKAERERAIFVTRLDDAGEEEMYEGVAHDDGAPLRDMKIDVANALKQLSGDDREIVRMMFMEGWTYREVQPLFADRFPNHAALQRYVDGYLKPKLRTVLADYSGKE